MVRSKLPWLFQNNYGCYQIPLAIRFLLWCSVKELLSLQSFGRKKCSAEILHERHENRHERHKIDHEVHKMKNAIQTIWLKILKKK